MSPRLPLSPSPCPSLPCPAVLFGKGGLNFDLPLLAVFNSRKPRLISPDSNWLKALCFFSRSLDPGGIALAGSTGTLTYDLAGAHAMRSGLAQLLVAPFPVLKADRELSKIYGESASGIPVVSCMLDAVTCSKKQAPICRDRILGALANFHLVLEIRSRGNLLAVLEQIQAKSPRPQFVFEPDQTNSSNAGNRVLLTKFSEHARGFKLPGPTICPPQTLFKLTARQIRIHPAFLKGDRGGFITLLSTTISSGAITSSTIPGHVPVPGRARLTINIWSICLTDIPSQATRPWKPSFGLSRKD